ncbi:PucR family transcriptional regulator [Leucobacter ruminantium]|uniref:Helix-turn-helix domain-containing protein n=1 Tax=Leucobacter ruminantium TaxID=1289170 RepID=A0A939LT64_9MICO|nr:helix-turn-helix domain-containing protein [Leucobacter ruminantium]MBO1804359.1 helix-turn-helix domain-containing protein [Leucobacter ruminantium]
MPRTVAEGEAVVERVLGRVLAYDRERGAGLVASLSAYFAANRSWRDAAAALGIHKQTLVYRMQKVEELTGRSLRDLGDQTELFLALRTLRLLDR